MNGFKKPSTGFPAATSLSLISAMILAKVGDDAEVPPMRVVLPPTTTSKFQPCVATCKRIGQCVLQVCIELETHIWVSTTCAVEHSGEVIRDGLEELGNGRVLVRRSQEQIRETAAGEIDRTFGVNTDGRADSSHERARWRERRNKRVVRALVGRVVPSANTAVA